MTGWQTAQATVRYDRLHMLLWGMTDCTCCCEVWQTARAAVRYDRLHVLLWGMTDCTCCCEVWQTARAAVRRDSLHFVGQASNNHLSKYWWARVLQRYCKITCLKAFVTDTFIFLELLSSYKLSCPWKNYCSSSGSHHLLHISVSFACSSRGM